jgi:pimeloyl-ACP methyl ester carboxylesterase
VDFAQAAGYRRIGLWGHSLGATKSIYYMATQGDHRVTCVVAGSPPRFSYSTYAALDPGEAFKHIAAQAQQHIDAGHPQTLIDTIYPIPLLVTAEVFIQKYGPEEKYDILNGGAATPGRRVARGDRPAQTGWEATGRPVFQGDPGGRTQASWP